MDRIVCGWCGLPTSAGGLCQACNHDPVGPHLQRGRLPPAAAASRPGRPGLDPRRARSRYTEARAALATAGRPATDETVAEWLGVSVRTVRRWRVA